MSPLLKVGEELLLAMSFTREETVIHGASEESLFNWAELGDQFGGIQDDMLRVGDNRFRELTQKFTGAPWWVFRCPFLYGLFVCEKEFTNGRVLLVDDLHRGFVEWYCNGAILMVSSGKSSPDGFR